MANKKKKSVGKKTKLSKTTKNYVRTRFNKLPPLNMGTPYEVEVKLIKPYPTGNLSAFGKWLVGVWEKVKHFWNTQIR